MRIKRGAYDSEEEISGCKAVQDEVGMCGESKLQDIIGAILDELTQEQQDRIIDKAFVTLFSRGSY